MAKASDPRSIEDPKTRPSVKLETTNIPKIVLDERKPTSSSLPSSLQTSLYLNTLTPLELGGISGDGRPTDIVNGRDNAGVGAGYIYQETRSNMPIRSSSDIGLPTVKPSNLMLNDGTSSSENYLEVFCSPRTQRKSVDTELNFTERDFCRCDWLQNLNSSNSLKVLTSASRSGSAISLNSECTARSIGLMSNDSDSERDVSLTESERLRFKPAQLRRFKSYPDEDSSPELCARSSQSLGDLIAVDSASNDYENDTGIVYTVPDFPVNVVAKSESAVELKTKGETDIPCDSILKEKGAQINEGNDGRKGFSLPRNMLSYKCDSHDAARDSRIRQWLQDMDSQR